MYIMPPVSTFAGDRLPATASPGRPDAASAPSPLPTAAARAGRRRWPLLAIPAALLLAAAAFASLAPEAATSSPEAPCVHYQGGCADPAQVLSGMLRHLPWWPR